MNTSRCSLKGIPERADDGPSSNVIGGCPVWHCGEHPDFDLVVEAAAMKAKAEAWTELLRPELIGALS